MELEFIEPYFFSNNDEGLLGNYYQGLPIKDTLIMQENKSIRLLPLCYLFSRVF